MENDQVPAGVKSDDEKLRYDLIPHLAQQAMVQVLTWGAKKYAPDNWRHVKGYRWRYYAATLRHLTAWWLGERLDPESGFPHLAHAMCCVAFLLEFDVISLNEEETIAPSNQSKTRIPEEEVSLSLADALEFLRSQGGIS